MSKSCTLARKRGIEAKALEEKGGIDNGGRQILKKREKPGKEKLAKRNGRKPDRLDEWTQKLFKRICRVLVSLQVWPNIKW